MLRAAAASTLRHLRAPGLGGGRRRLCSSSAGAIPNSNPNPDGYIHSETEAKELFEIWCNKYDKKYPSEEEKLMRFGIFRKSLECCSRQNQKPDNPISSFADMTVEEFLEHSAGWKQPF